MAKKFVEYPRSTENEEEKDAKTASGSYISDTKFNLVIREWFVREGDFLKTGHPIVEVETDKGVDNIEAQLDENGARVVKIIIPASEDTLTYNMDELPVLLAEIEVEDGNTVKDKPLSKRAAEDIPKEGERLVRYLETWEGGSVEVEIPVPPIEDTNKSSEKIIRAAPSTRRLAKEKGVDLSNVVSTGSGGIITAKDVEEHLSRAEKPPDSKPEKKYEVSPLSAHRITSAEYMEASWQIPHAGPGIDINPEPLTNLRNELKDWFKEAHGVRLHLDTFFVAAVGWLLGQEEFRILNSYWHKLPDGKAEHRLYKNVNVGVSVASPRLVVLCVKDADKKSFVEITKEVARIVADAQAGKPKLSDLRGVTATVNNTGAPVLWRGMKFPGDESPFSLMLPNTAMILSFASSRKVADELKMRLALKFDHRPFDGDVATAFIRVLQYLIENPEKILVLN